METKIQIPSLLGAEKDVLILLGQILADTACHETERLDLQTAVAEACLNAIEHGNRLNPDLRIDISISSGNDQVTVEILDHGEGAELRSCVRNSLCNIMDVSSLHPSPSGETASQDETYRGWGLYLVNHLVDDWDYRYLADQKRFCMRLTKYFRKGEMA